MKRKIQLIPFLLVLFGCPSNVHAQFNTVRDERGKYFELISNQEIDNQPIVIQEDTIRKDSIDYTTEEIVLTACEGGNNDSNRPVRKKHLDLNKTYDSLPDLTISNLLKEIRRNGIKHEKVVIAQAILETGWFTSSVCRNKNNLFGLTNPRTGKYYEFNHWTESVKAYYTKVQYRYKGGNYLLWLDKIGYAEDKVYVQSLIRLMNQYFK